MKKKLASTIRDYAIISVGLILFVLAWTVFIIPAEITGGGVSGIAAVIFYGWEVPVWITYLTVNAFLLILALKVLGANFGIKTIYSMSLVSGLFAILPQIIKEPIIDDTFLAAVLGGMISGVGLGIVFSRGGSTGGTDIIAMIINKYRNISPGKVILACDVIIISSSYFIFLSLEKLVYGFVLMWVVSYSLDAFMSGAKRSTQIFIFSNKYDEIADFINKETDRGVTLINGKGWYTKDNVNILMTVVRKRESSIIFRKIKSIDPDAFITMGSVMGVFGQGFDKIKI